MSNRWFRMYAEFAHDPKVQMMSEAMQRRLLMIFCLRCGNDDVTLHVTEIAFSLRVTDAEIAATKAEFIARGFIDENWKILNWEKRQFRSDSSRERVTKHRALQKQQCNVTVTSKKRPRTDTEQIQNREEKKDTLSNDFDEFWKIYPPNKDSKKNAFKTYQKIIKETPHAEIIRGAGLYAADIVRTGTGKQYTKQASTWLNAAGWTIDYTPDPAKLSSGHPPSKFMAGVAALFEDESGGNGTSGGGGGITPHLPSSGH